MSAIRLSFGSRAGGASDYQQNNSNSGFFSGGPYASVEALADALKTEIQGSADSAIPDCTTVELSLAFNALIPLVRPGIGPYSEGGPNDLPDEFKHDVQNIDNGCGTSRAEPVATAGAIVNIPDPGQRAIVQRAASRGLIQAIEASDGFRYSFNNAWAAKDEEGSRFSYICQDSMQNKDRHANGFTRTLKHLKGEGERGPRKPTYDCKGSVSVKFSSQRQSVDVYYRHYAIHATAAERKAMPRMPPKPKAPVMKSGPKETGGLFATLQAENVASSALAAMDPVQPPAQPSNVGRPLKRKRESGGPPMPLRNPNQPMSLMELLSQSETANAPPQPESEMANSTRLPSKAPVAYELPSWQTPPPTLNRPGQSYPAPYPPPQFRKPAQSTPTPRQKPSGQGTQAQGLFTTMKPAQWKVHQASEQFPYGPVNPSPVVFKPPQTTTSSRFTTPAVPRAKSSCNNCRLRKLKCDEGHPCTACIKAHKTDCAYEGSTRQQDPPPSNSSWGNLSQNSRPNNWQNSSQSQGQNQSQSQSTQSQNSQFSSSWQQQSSGTELTGFSSAPASQDQHQMQREDSPDPWFPKR